MPTRVKGESAAVDKEIAPSWLISETLGCQPCSRRRINCDRTEPSCLKCIHAEIECPGLGTRYRWARPLHPTALKQRYSEPRASIANGFVMQKTRRSDSEASSKDEVLATRSASSTGDQLHRKNDDQVMEEESTALSKAIIVPMSKCTLSTTPIPQPDQWIINYCTLSYHLVYVSIFLHQARQS